MMTAGGTRLLHRPPTTSRDIHTNTTELIHEGGQGQHLRHFLLLSDSPSMRSGQKLYMGIYR